MIFGKSPDGLRPRRLIAPLALFALVMVASVAASRTVEASESRRAAEMTERRAEVVRLAVEAEVRGFVDTLRNGRHQGRGRQLLPPMPWASFGQMDDADLKAIFAYLRTVPKVRNKVPDPVPPGA